MKKVISILIVIVLISGCAHRARRQKIVPEKPSHETPTVYNFKSTDKDKAKTFQSMGMDYLSQKDFRLAQTYFKKALKLNPKLYQAWYCLGLLNIDSQEGHDYLEKSIECKSNFSPPYYWLAYYNCRIGQDKKAIALFKKYIELAQIDPGEEERLSAAKQALQELLSGKDGEALKLIRKSSEAK